MATLPSPARAMTLGQIAQDPEQVGSDLMAGGAVLVLSDDRTVYLGVLTRDPSVLGDAELAQQIEAGHIPPLAELLADPGVDETQPA
ncbi:MAG: hypothetical protein MSC31_16975 [Solirubrobacteraceae bacterium MAG38_C4-C5]|nr:hypothetical protein [Candidatus Siliceabacter maunaloa]